MASTYSPLVTVFAVIAKTIRSQMPAVDIGEVLDDIDKLLDESIAAEGYVIYGVAEAGEGYVTSRTVDLSQIDFDALRAHFASAHKHTEAQKLRSALSAKVARMVRLNRSRMDYLTRLQYLIDDYNAGSMNVEVFFDKLLGLAQALNDEEQRTISENLSEEELAIFDLLTRPKVQLSDKERDQVKRVARDLLETLKHEMLVLDWKKRQQTRAAVRLAVEKALDAGLPRSYSSQLYQQKCDDVYQHIYDCYAGAGQSIYVAAAS